MSDEPEFPVLTQWRRIEAEMRRGPAISALPIDELVRITRSQFFVGAALALQGLRAVLNTLPPNTPLDKHMALTAFYLLSCSEAIGERTEIEITLAQTIAVLKAHEVQGEPAMTEIVKVQVPLKSTVDDPGLLVYAKGRKKLCTITPTAEVMQKIGDQPKRYFHGTWTGKTWVLNDVAPDQPW